MTNRNPTAREQDYQITVYDDKTIEEMSNLNGSHSELEKSCREMARYFQNKYKGRIDIKVIIR